MGLNSHMKISHGPASGSPAPLVKDAVPKYVFHVNDKVLLKKSNDRPEKIFECTCGRTYKTSHGLRQHKLIHHKEPVKVEGAEVPVAGSAAPNQVASGNTTVTPSVPAIKRPKVEPKKMEDASPTLVSTPVVSKAVTQSIAAQLSNLIKTKGNNRLNIPIVASNPDGNQSNQPTYQLQISSGQVTTSANGSGPAISSMVIKSPMLHQQLVTPLNKTSTTAKSGQ